MPPLSEADGPQLDAEILEMHDVLYREAVKALTWIATMTQPHPPFTTHNLAKHSDVTQGPHTGRQI